MSNRFSQINSGNYRIVNCDDNAHLVGTLLRYLSSALGPVIEDSRRQIPSPAFSTFFGDVNFGPHVSGLLLNVTTGVAMDDQGSPILFCTTGINQLPIIDQDTGVHTDMYLHCQETEGMIMTIWYDTPYIVICPFFFTTPNLQAVPPGHNRPKVARNMMEYLGTGASVVQYQMWSIFNQIVHYYVFMAHREQTSSIDNINACMRLEGNDSVLNPQSYLYYAASKCVLREPKVRFWPC